MYYYILDSHKLSLDKFERLQIALQGLLAEFKISGEMARVTSLRTIADLVDTASSRGVKTLVACGSDDTFNLMLAALKGRNFTLGFVPFDEASHLAQILGVRDLPAAVKTIAARRIEKMDLAVVAGSYFLNSLEFGLTTHSLQGLGWWQSAKILSSPGHGLTIRIDNSYNLDINCLGGLVANARPATAKNKTIANPTDGFLDVLILERLSKINILRYKSAILAGQLEEVPTTTVIKCRRVDFIKPLGFPLTISGKTLAKFPACVEIIPNKLRMIVGKTRTF